MIRTIKRVAKVAAANKIIIIPKVNSGACGIAEGEADGDWLDAGVEVGVADLLGFDVGCAVGWGVLRVIELVRFAVKPALSIIWQ